MHADEGADDFEERLQQAEAEKARLEQLVKVERLLTDQVVDFLPDAASRYRQLVENLGESLDGNVAEARECLKNLLGPISLHPSADGSHLEADLLGIEVEVQENLVDARGRVGVQALPDLVQRSREDAAA